MSYIIYGQPLIKVDTSRGVKKLFSCDIRTFLFFFFGPFDPIFLDKTGFLLFILIFLSVAGNILVCVAIYTDRGLRRIGNLFLASLAIADLLVGCLVMTLAGVNDLLGYWIFGPRFCDTWVACDVMCSTASILNLCAISLDRYIHIKDPLRSVHNLRLFLFHFSSIFYHPKTTKLD